MAENDRSSDDDSDDEMYEASVRARLAMKLGQAPISKLWPEMAKHLADIRLGEKVDKAGSELVRITDVLPHSMAMRMHEIVKSAGPRVWLSEDHYRHKGEHTGFGHSFKAATPDSIERSASDVDLGNEEVSKLLRTFHEALCPESMKHMFGLASYDRGAHITRHDDGASQEINGETWYRNTAVIYYLTPDWTHEDGGLFLDYGVTSAPKDPPVEYVPQFNSLVAFRVWANGAHMHEVTPVLTDKMLRFSVFGWFLSRDMPQ
mmetsp:Transcript_35261/g.67407  ORF Transcript_35261/g.67407 Transcript_35261/m.67407 type:complete len:261 (-) Transcript_35261:425-1207(-)|eukprot:CAMPEP_0114242528 /NCGR_PEP_ID=MMETSP0058-20121206/10226_1 /TAXON_ID=36894 /ORGANISM="Pyramimonas parkeae, CCMP726" /LENGTH=260 /DNA_ID=CAMNT_0001355151 /DNA_START=388 /DNA_END=1170 /DNA_ORIENTATION=+